MKGLTKEKRDQLILIAIGTLGVLAGLWFGVIKSQNSKLKACRQELRELDTDLQKAERLISDQENTQRELKAAEDKLEAIVGALAQGDLYSWMLQTLNRFKVSHRVSIPQISREVMGMVPQQPGFPYKSAIFKIQGSAYYHELGKFIADFENRFPFMRLQNLKLSKKLDEETAATSEKLDFQVEIVTLIKPTTTS